MFTIAKYLERNGDTLLTREEVLYRSEPAPSTIGIYFLIQDREIVYVGQSIALLDRVRQHPNKTFNRVTFLACKAKDLNRLEQAYIGIFNPRYNIVHTEKHRVSYPKQRRGPGPGKPSPYAM